MQSPSLVVVMIICLISCQLFCELQAGAGGEMAGYTEKAELLQLARTK
jgi:hypothetical protein